MSRRRKPKAKGRRPVLVENPRQARKNDAAAPTRWGQPLELTISAKLKLRWLNLPDMADLTDAQKLEFLITFYERAHAEAINAEFLCEDCWTEEVYGQDMTVCGTFAGQELGA